MSDYKNALCKETPFTITVENISATGNRQIKTKIHSFKTNSFRFHFYIKGLGNVATTGR